MASEEKINFIKERFKADPKITTRDIQVALKAKFGKGVKNSFISEVKALLKRKKEGNKKGNEGNKKESKKKTEKKIIHSSTPRNAELFDAFIYMEDIRRNFKAAYEAWKVKYAAEIKRYVKYKYANYAAFTEVVNTHFEELKTILEEKNENKS